MNLLAGVNGALLIHKSPGLTSAGVLEDLKDILARRYEIRKRRDLPKIGHTGTLDPFATGLLVVLLGDASKLSRYFLSASKHYTGRMRFGETTIPGDPTEAISEKSEILPKSVEELNQRAALLTSQPYLQTPPMHSAKKVNGQPLYELARQGLEIERAAKVCHLYQFNFFSYEAPNAEFEVQCSSGTYVRTLAQDFGRLMGTVGMLDSLMRTEVGPFNLSQAKSTKQLDELFAGGAEVQNLECYLPFDRLLDHFLKVQVSKDEAHDLKQGRQQTFVRLMARFPQTAHEVALYQDTMLVAVASRPATQPDPMRGPWDVLPQWSLDRVFAKA